MKRSALLLSLILLFTAGVVRASETNGTIVSGGNAGYAWSNQAGWVNFGIATTTVALTVTDSAITGYAWNSNYGWINMSPTNGGITIAANGALSGYAWGSSLGWINFSGVSINSSGKFTGTASGTIIGTLTFDCTNCDVRTDYRPLNFRTTPIPTPTPSGGGGSGGGVDGVVIISQPIPTPTPVLPLPAPSLETPTFPPGATPTDSVGSGDAGGEDSLLPAQLFDIRLLVDSANVARIIDLVARVTFESFGRVPTPVALTFTIVDEGGNEVWRSIDTTTVQTSAVFVKRFFEVGDLAPGSYTLRLNTLYNTDVSDIFEAPFTISPAQSESHWLLWFIGGIIVAILLLLVFLVWRRRRHVCPVCGHTYKDKEWALACEEWCSSRDSYNPSIVSHAIEKKS